MQAPQTTVDPGEIARFPRVDHVHFYGFYIGNYPGLEAGRVVELCDMLNALPASVSG